MTVDCYSLRYVTIKKEEVGARPIGWDSEDVDGFGTNAEGEKVHANKWMTTCPYCACLIEFDLDAIHRVTEDVRVVADYVSCPTCNAGVENIPEVVDEEGALDESGAIDVAAMIGDVAEFVDPLLEDFGFEVDFERMPGV